MPTTTTRIAFIVLLLAVASCSKSRTGEPPPEPGAACGEGLPCAGGLACVSDMRFPGGYCSTVCDTAECPEGSRCVEGFGPRLCLAPCGTDSDCRPGYQCWAGSCRPLCVADGDCGELDAVCDPDGRCSGTECAIDPDCGPGQRCAAGRCIVSPMIDAGSGDLPDGSPCSAASQCASSICAPPSQGGVCVRPCAERAACGFEEVCSPVPMDLDGDGSGDVVATACVVASPAGEFLAGSCGSDDRCESRACVRGQCAEACNDDTDCLAGQICTDVSDNRAGGAAFSGCGYGARGGALVVEDVALGDLGVGTGSPSRRINFAVPQDTVSVTLMARRTGGEQLPLAFVEVWDPINDRLFDYGDLTSWIDQPVRWIPLDTEEHISMLIPNSTPDRITFRDGRYGFTVGGLSSMGGPAGTVDVELTARLKRAASADIASGSLDLNVFLVGIGVTQSAAPTNARLQGALTELGSIFTAQSISIGSITYVEITGSDATALSVIDSSDGPTSEMATLLRLSTSRTNRAVNVFLVRGISTGAGERGGIALGIAGGIPGPPYVHGTMHSGVLVSYDSSVVGTGTQGQQIIAQIMAHEIGHYLGLFHNRESLRACAAGTGPTETSPCAPFGGGDVLEDTSRTDGRNLMWYALGGADGRTYNVQLTAGQGFVMRRSSVVQ